MPMKSLSSPMRSNPWIDQLHNIAPGLMLASSLALLAGNLQKIPGLGFLSPLSMAVIIGFMIRNTIGVPTIYRPGLIFSLKKLLRVSIVLLGLQLSLGQVLAIGPQAVAIIVITTITTFAFTNWLGKRLGVNRKLTKLIAAGTSICGASAIVATNSVIDGSDEDMAYAVTIITLFGSLSMLLYPYLSSLLKLSPEIFGLWSGISIHEVAQVIATAFQGGQVSGEIGTVSKLARILFLIPTVVTLSLVQNAEQAQNPNLNQGQSSNFKQLPIPWFILAFIVMVGLNSLSILPIALKDWVVQNNKFLITLALASMGLEINFLKIRQTGLKPLYLGGAAWLFIATLSLGLLRQFYVI
jgi:uncharacterized integral membrane protein (TIGR00698 family)